MIKSFRDKDSESLFCGHCQRKWNSFRSQAERKPALLDAASSLDFLKAPPGNNLEKLEGNRSDQWSIRINDRWRVRFLWDGTNARELEIVDYH